jgi:hypothetical protein
MGGSDSDARPVPDVEPERPVRPVFQQAHPTTRLREDVDVDYGGYLSEERKRRKLKECFL